LFVPHSNNRTKGKATFGPNDMVIHTWERMQSKDWRWKETCAPVVRGALLWFAVHKARRRWKEIVRQRCP